MLMAISAILALAAGARTAFGTRVHSAQCRCAAPVYRRVSTPGEAAESIGVIQRARGALFVAIAGPTIPRRTVRGRAVPVRPAFRFRVEQQWAGALGDTVTTFGSAYGWCGDPQFIAGRRYVVRAWRQRDSLIRRRLRPRGRGGRRADGAAERIGWRATRKGGRPKATTPVEVPTHSISRHGHAGSAGVTSVDESRATITIPAPRALPSTVGKSRRRERVRCPERLAGC
jgi:hypothetical protein